MSEYVEVKVAELEGAALDWAVGKADGIKFRHDPMGFKSGANAGYWIWGDGPRGPFLKVGAPGLLGYSPSTTWHVAGPIIERFKPHMTPIIGDQGWCAEYDIPIGLGDCDTCEINGPTFLVAAMRAVVSEKLGETVKVPKELI